MIDTALEAILRRDRHAVLIALLLLTALTWIYVLWLATHMAMPASAMPGMDRDIMAPQARPWAAPDLLFGFCMWAVMMAGMMLPSSAPVILLYARVGRQAETQRAPFVRLADREHTSVSTRSLAVEFLRLGERGKIGRAQFPEVGEGGHPVPP